MRFDQRRIIRGVDVHGAGLERGCIICFDGGPQQTQQARGIGRPHLGSVGADHGVAEQVQAVARTRARDVQQPRLLEPVLVAPRAIDVTIQGIAFDFVLPAHRAHDLVLVTMRVGQVEPVHDGFAAARRITAEAVQQHVIELESLGLVHGHDLQPGRRRCRDMFGVQLGLEHGDVRERAADFEAREYIEEVVGIGNRGGVALHRRAAELQPRTLDAPVQAQRPVDA